MDKGALLMAGAATDSNQRGDGVIPYRAWWGLLGCAALMAVLVGFAAQSDGSAFPPDKGNFWYLWQLSEPTFWTRLSAWLPYALHQLSIWYLIAAARKARPRYIFGLHSFNVWALGINAFFIVLHVVQTRLFYDGLAQDVHEMTSMGSVILMLLLILLMENGRRGLFFGRKVASLEATGEIVRRYHGYYFSWAIIYTFWYHPVEMTSGHLVGFAYMMLLMLQSSLFFTRFHTNRWWTMFLETLFVVHGAIVAFFIVQQGQTGPWAMFLFGGVATFLITQLHGLGLGRTGKLAIALPLLGVMAAFYSVFPEHIMGVTRLPLIMYIGTFLMAAIIWLLMRSTRFVQSLRSATADGPDGLPKCP
jgi:hypothetical protein